MTLYCCYCLESKGDKYQCCEENHFVPFDDLYEDQQAQILEDEDEESNQSRMAGILASASAAETSVENQRSI